ncbi:hypothetical protein Tco_1009328, partial [Tanacetum coccineum]
MDAGQDENTIRWYVETEKGALYLVNRGNKVVDYLDLKPQDPDKIDWSENNMNCYHFKPDTEPQTDHKFAEGKHDICILRGTWDGRDAIVKKETDGEFEYFAFEVCGVTLHEYVMQHTYKEMSETTLKIM